MLADQVNSFSFLARFWILEYFHAPLLHTNTIFPVFPFPSLLVSLRYPKLFSSLSLLGLLTRKLCGVWHSCFSKDIVCSGGSRISTRRGRQLPGGAPIYNFDKFSQKLHEIERIWTPGGGGARPKFYYVDPPLV